MKDDRVYIGMILDSIEKVENFTLGVTEEIFKNNQEKQSAVILQLVLIVENTNNLTEDTKSKIDLPWRDIKGFRNMAIHDYLNLEVDIVWLTVKNRIPELKTKLLEYLDKI